MTIMDTMVLPLLGGALIGLASALMLVLSGRIAGISGILNGVFGLEREERTWRLAFVAGLLVGGLALTLLLPSAFRSGGLGSMPVMVVAGLVVGFGSRLGSGCTSGHGVCGIGRLSARGLVATLTFMATGAATVFVTRHLL